MCNRLIETNYYGGGGSKLKATAGEYKALYDFLSADGHKFIWITDGTGCWCSQINQLTKAFKEIDYVLNISFAKSGLLEAILK